MKDYLKIIIAIVAMISIGACGYNSSMNDRNYNYADSLKDTTNCVYENGVMDSIFVNKDGVTVNTTK